MPPGVTLTAGKEKPVQAGHPWIFSGALGRSGEIAAPPGAWVEVRDSRGEVLGVGLCSPRSSIRVRMVALGAGGLPFEARDGGLEHELGFWAGRLRSAVARRRRQGIDVGPGAAFRALNSEGDGVPGVVVDVLGAAVVIQISTWPMHLRRAVLLDAVREVLGPTYILQADPPHLAGLEGFEAERSWVGQAPAEPVAFSEGPVRYALSAEVLQKTGHYLDVREIRSWVGQQARGVAMFDGFCFTGGFALHAAASGATSVLGVDSSAAAVAQAQANLAALGEGVGAVEFVCADVRDQLRSCFDRGRRFDVVQLDPPKYAPRKQDRDNALKLYTALLVEGLRVLGEGGLIGISSCSHHVAEGDLVRALAIAGGRARRLVDVVHTASQPADHPWPAAMDEGRYLSFVFGRAR